MLVLRKLSNTKGGSARKSIQLECTTHRVVLVGENFCPFSKKGTDITRVYGFTIWYQVLDTFSVCAKKGWSKQGIFWRGNIWSKTVITLNCIFVKRKNDCVALLIPPGEVACVQETFVLSTPFSMWTQGLSSLRKYQVWHIEVHRAIRPYMNNHDRSTNTSSCIRQARTIR